MDVRIGVIHTAKEIEIELPDDTDRDQVHAKVDDALADSGGVLWLIDRHGAELAVPADRIGWVHIDRAGGERRIGFST